MGQRRLTVVQLLPALETGGVEKGTVEVAKALRSEGHRAIVISAGGRMVKELEAIGAEHIQWAIGKKSLWTLRYVYTLRRWLSANRVDILHARSRLPAWIAYLAWKGMDPQTRPHFITTVHGMYSVKKYSSIMARGEVVIAVSETIKKYILENYPGVEESRIRVIHRGVDPVQFPYGYQPERAWLENWYTQYPQLRGQSVLTLPGRLTRLKGHEDFVNLMTTLRDRGCDVYGLVVGGEDPRRKAYADEIRQRVRDRGLQDRILFTGYRSDMREIYAVSSIVLSLSTKPESFGRTVLEALCLGVPVVGYEHGGVGEILREIYPSGLVPVRDASALADRVLDILEGDTPVPEQEIFTLSSMLEKTLSVYKSLQRS